MIPRPPFSTELQAGLRLTRPTQWPILTAQLAVGMLLTAPVSGSTWSLWLAGTNWLHVGLAWLVWVVLLNGGSLAFNSAYDRDTGPVAYLKSPPMPPVWLAKAAVTGMALGALLGMVLVGRFFGLVVGVCVVLSVLYSHPQVRWKSKPGMDLLTNGVGYGAGTTLAGLSAIAGGVPSVSGWWFAAGFGLLFGSFYPLTQIYQTAEDQRRNDRTLTTALGVRAALMLALGLGLIGGAALVQGCLMAERTAWLGILVSALGLWSGHLIWWLLKSEQWVDKDHERGMYRALVLWAVVDVALAVVWLRG